jgi:hypothetical protein
MNMIDVTSLTGTVCTCMANAVTASWDGRTYHAETCPAFVPTREQYVAIGAERDKLRAVARAARAWADQEAPEPLEYGDAIINALDALKVSVVGNEGPVDPYWMK